MRAAERDMKEELHEKIIQKHQEAARRHQEKVKKNPACAPKDVAEMYSKLFRGFPCPVELLVRRI